MTRAWNPVGEGIKRHSSAHAYFLELKTKTKMTAMEWDWYRARQKQWEPEAYAQDMAKARHRSAMKSAEVLSDDDLRSILAARASAKIRARKP